MSGLRFRRNNAKAALVGFPNRGQPLPMSAARNLVVIAGKLRGPDGGSRPLQCRFFGHSEPGLNLLGSKVQEFIAFQHISPPATKIFFVLLSRNAATVAIMANKQGKMVSYSFSIFYACVLTATANWFASKISYVDAYKKSFNYD